MLFIAITYYLPMIVTLLGGAYLAYMDRNGTGLATFILAAVIASVIPLINIIFAFFVFDEIDWDKLGSQLKGLMGSKNP